MSENGAYIQSLKDLNLSFEECIYAVAFGLEDEIRQDGKEAVFSGLPCKEVMAEKAAEILSGNNHYAFCKTLGYPYPKSEEIEFDRYKWCQVSVDQCFGYAIEELRGGTDRWQRMPSRFRLLDEAWLRSVILSEEAKNINTSAVSSLPSEALTVPDALTRDAVELCAQLQRLMEEVQFYNQKRDQALAAIEALLTEIKDRTEVPETLSVEALAASSPQASPNLQGSIEQICWPGRSLRVLRELKLETLAEVVEYFANFDNFVNGREITLREWSVIVAILQQEKLLMPGSESIEVGLDDDLETLIKLSSSSGVAVRSYTCLRRANINTVGDMLAFFAGGAQDGWQAMTELRNFGKASLRYVIEQMQTWTIVIPPEQCYPTPQSPIEILDFDAGDLMVLREYGVRTISELMAACASKNRFCGLRYLHEGMYKAALQQLKTYGFVSQGT